MYLCIFSYQLIHDYHIFNNQEYSKKYMYNVTVFPKLIRHRAILLPGRAAMEWPSTRDRV